LPIKKCEIVLPIIVISQFYCTSLWSASNAALNAALNDLIEKYNLSIYALKNLNSVIHFDFIIGALRSTLFTIIDRFSPLKFFFVCAISLAFFNSCLVFDNNNNNNTYLRTTIEGFLTNFSLTGMHPIEMRIIVN
jgi:hypothetical protein